MTELEHDSPRYLLGFLVAAIFAAEGLIVSVLSYFGLSFGIGAEVVNSTFLFLALAPLLYFGIFKELREKSSKIQNMGSELRKVNAQLEIRMSERETELECSKRDLEKAVNELKSKQKNLAKVRNMHRMLHSATDENEAYRLAGSELAKILPQSSGALYIAKEAGTILVRVAQWPDSRAWEEHIAPEACWALRVGQTHRRNGHDVASCAHGPEVNGIAKLKICVPLIARGETLGVLSVVLFDVSDSEQSQDYEELISLVAGGLALAVANIQLRMALHARAYQDQLTGLFNRHFLDKHLGLEIHKSDRSHKPLSIVMLDVDNFKRLNDLHGHDAGDFVLAALAQKMMETFRLSDVSCRFGGEEFVVVLPESSTETTARRIGEFLEKVAQMDMGYHGKQLGQISFSAGVATYGVHANDKESLLRAADTALYASKKAGKNRVCVASQLMSDTDNPTIEQNDYSNVTGPRLVQADF